MIAKRRSSKNFEKTHNSHKVGRHSSVNQQGTESYRKTGLLARTRGTKTIQKNEHRSAKKFCRYNNIYRNNRNNRAYQVLCTRKTSSLGKIHSQLKIV
jgi:hypothetical protein